MLAQPLLLSYFYSMTHKNIQSVARQAALDICEVVDRSNVELSIYGARAFYPEGFWLVIDGQRYRFRMGDFQIAVPLATEAPHGT